MSIRAVGFDLDGTLAIPTQPRATLLEEALAAVDGTERSSISRAEYLDAHSRNLTADTRTPVFRDALPPDSTANPAALADAYRNAITDALVPVAGAKTLLATLREEYAVGLLTNGPVKAQRAKLDALEWWGAFDAVCISGELTAGKPDRRAFETLLDRLDSRAGATAFVGDQPEQDIEGAAAAGLIPVQVLPDDGTDPHPSAAASVRRDRLAATLPALLSSL